MLNFLDENDDIFRLFPLVAYMNRGDVFRGRAGEKWAGISILKRKNILLDLKDCYSKHLMIGDSKFFN